VKPSAVTSGEGLRRESASPRRRERTGARPRVARDRHPAVFASPKAVRGSRDRGCNGHRILRRVPADRRHPGSSRGVSFHEKASTVVLAAVSSSNPCQTSQKEDARSTCSAGEGSRGVRTKRQSRQGCQRLDRVEHRGKKTPTLVSPGRKAVELELRVRRRSAEAVSDVVKRPVPRSTRRSLRLRRASPQRKLRERAGNARGAGAHSSIGWQKSVGRIARLLHREVARPVGDPRGR
jgi:hypothetical protein